MKKSNSKELQTLEPTLNQVIGYLSIGKIWAIIIAFSTAITAVAGAGFYLGLRVGEISGQDKLNAISEKFSRAEAESIVQSSKAQQTTEKLQQSTEYAAKLKMQIADLDKQLVSLNERLGRSNTCGFLQQQITSLEQQIEIISSGKRLRTSGVFIYSADSEEQQKHALDRKVRDDAEITQLQQRMLAYTQQLNSCTK
ncbi:hypothetical protein [Delftia acidovorans]|jgi:hypothetical protein|uniref:hypothetical protein n=1 Tax=Delftia acidovorans TaxID=80866 RepID=UPI00284C55F8|nr:hypothetical protein [Delftia acidovorans]